MTTLAATVVVAGLCGCAPDPFADPTPAPTPSGVVSGFASHEEAFAAAEATYRAYVDAGNAQRAGDPSSDPSRYLSGAALEGERETQEDFAKAKVRIEGDLNVASFRVTNASSEVLDAVVCLDVRDTRLLDEAGQDITPHDREDRLGLVVTFEWTTGHALISDSKTSDEQC